MAIRGRALPLGVVGRPYASHNVHLPSSPGHEEFAMLDTVTLGCVIKDNNICLDQVLIDKKSVVDDVAPLFGLPFGIKFPFATLMFISLTIGSYFKFIMYQFMYTNKKDCMNRPINVLTLTGAIIHHVTHICSGSWHALVCIINSPLNTFVGDEVCWVMMVVGVYGIVYLTVGSFWIAVYRTLYIRHECWVRYVIGEKVLLLIVLFLSIGISGVICFLYVFEDNAHRTGYNMCVGLSVTQTELLMDYDSSRGKEQVTTTYLAKLTTLSCITFQLIEFTIYLWFFYHRYKNDNGNITKVMKQEDVQKRNAKNAGTFLGQFYGFIVEYSFLVSILTIHIFYADEDFQHIRGLVVMAKFMDFGLLSAIEVYSSPVLRRFMNSKN